MATDGGRKHLSKALISMRWCCTQSKFSSFYNRKMMKIRVWEGGTWDASAILYTFHRDFDDVRGEKYFLSVSILLSKLYRSCAEELRANKLCYFIIIILHLESVFSIHSLLLLTIYSNFTSSMISHSAVSVHREHQHTRTDNGLSQKRERIKEVEW